LRVCFRRFPPLFRLLQKIRNGVTLSVLAAARIVIGASPNRTFPSKG